MKPTDELPVHRPQEAMETQHPIDQEAYKRGRERLEADESKREAELRKTMREEYPHLASDIDSLPPLGND